MVRHLSRQSAFGADADGLSYAIHHSGRFIAHVRDMHSTKLSHYFCDLDHLLCRSKVSRNVEQPGREAERSVAHGLPRQVFHPSDLGHRGAAVLQPEDLLADRALPCKRAKVHSHLVLRQLLEKRCERDWRAAIVPFQQRRYTLANVVLCIGILKNPAPGMRMDINEAGGDY